MSRVERWSPARRPIVAAGALVLVAIATLMGSVAIARAASADGKPIFDQLCAGCHSIGGGDLVGPDLAGIADRREAEWVKQFILVPDEVIASGDPIAKELLDKYGAPMPNLGVTAAQIGPLLAYLGFAEQPPTTPTTPTTPAPGAGDADRGEDLFTGAIRFDAGGPSCLSCHSVAGVGALGGGQLGPDLTGAHAKYGGAQGLAAALETVPFPTMAPIFTRRALTAEERQDLVAFLETAPDQQRLPAASGKLLGYSALAAVGLAFLALLIWRHRLTGVRKPLVNRARRK